MYPEEFNGEEMMYTLGAEEGPFKAHCATPPLALFIATIKGTILEL
jgi:hypothetical protein